MTSKYMRIYCILVMILWGALLGARPNERFFFSYSEKRNGISASVDFDPALFWGVGYHHSLPLTFGAFSRKLNLQGKFRSYAFNFFDVDVNASTFVFGEGLFNVLVNLGLDYKYASNDIHHANVMSAEISSMPGLFRKNWAVGLDIRFKQGLFQHLRHTSYYKEIYPLVMDGLYAAPNSNLYFALAGGISIADTVELSLRAGYRLSTTFKDYSPYVVPYFANVGLIYNF